jgi:hypothetical protein
MFEHYLAALLSLRQARDLAHSALPDAWESEHGWLSPLTVGTPA